MLTPPDLPGGSDFTPIDLNYIEAMEERADRVVEKVRSNSYAPSGRKPSLVFNATQLAKLCGKSPSAMARLLDKAASLNLADGTSMGANGNGAATKKRSFTQAEAVDWVRAVSDTYFKRPPGSLACTLTIGNFKGGVGKTVASTSIAQALSLMGYKVLAIDLDPQGSMTSLLDVDRMAVDDEQTMLPLARPLSDAGARDTLQESIQETYWTGVDLVAGSPSLFNAEFFLPMRQMNVRQEPTFRFLEVLDRALNKGIRQEYDYIIIDTPPALSYVTMNAFWAADALLMPLPAEGLDLMSSTRFWSMFTELARSAEKTAAAPKTFAWIGIVPSKVDHTKQYTKFNLDVMRAAYGENLLNAELPLSSAVSVGGTTLATVYDIQKYVGSKKTYERARVAFDALAAQIDFLTRTRKWGQVVKEIPLQVKL